MQHYLMQSRSPGQPANLACLVWEGNDRIAEHIQSMTSPAYWQDVLAHCPAGRLLEARAVIRSAVLFVIGEFDRRFTQRLRRSPYNLLTLANEPCHVECERRRDVAGQLLSAPDFALHITARKVKAQFNDELRFIQDTGMCPLSLYCPLRLLACEWKADVQELEGVNNMVEMACSIAPGISQALLDARVANRKDVGMGSRATRVTKWSAISSYVESIVEETQNHVVGAVDEIMREPLRWGGVAPMRPIDMRSVVEIEPISAPLAICDWARTYSNRWLAQAKAISSGEDLAFGKGTGAFVLFDHESARGLAWLCVAVHRYTCHMVKCNWDGDALQICEPLQFSS